MNQNDKHKNILSIYSLKYKTKPLVKVQLRLKSYILFSLIFGSMNFAWFWNLEQRRHLIAMNKIKTFRIRRISRQKMTLKNMCFINRYEFFVSPWWIVEGNSVKVDFYEDSSKTIIYLAIFSFNSSLLHLFIRFKFSMLIVQFVWWFRQWMHVLSMAIMKKSDPNYLINQLTVSLSCLVYSYRLH